MRGLRTRPTSPSVVVPMLELLPLLAVCLGDGSRCGWPGRDLTVGATVHRRPAPLPPPSSFPSLFVFHENRRTHMVIFLDPGPAASLSLPVLRDRFAAASSSGFSILFNCSIFFVACLPSTDGPDLPWHSSLSPPASRSSGPSPLPLAAPRSAACHTGSRSSARNGASPTRELESGSPGLRHLGSRLACPAPSSPGPESLGERWPGIFLARGHLAVPLRSWSRSPHGLPGRRPRARSWDSRWVRSRGQRGRRRGDPVRAGLDDSDEKILLSVYGAARLLGGGLAEPRWPPARRGRGLLVFRGPPAQWRPSKSPPRRSRGWRPEASPARGNRADGDARPRTAVFERSGMHLLTFLSRERVIFSDPYAEGYPPYARLVDGAETVGWWLRGRAPGLGDSLTALGARFEVRHIGNIGGTFVNLALTPQALRELDPATLTVTASLNGAEASSMVDRDAATFWSSGQPKRGGEWFQVDLGRVAPVAPSAGCPGLSGGTGGPRRGDVPGRSDLATPDRAA